MLPLVPLAPAARHCSRAGRLPRHEPRPLPLPLQGRPHPPNPAPRPPPRFRPRRPPAAAVAAAAASLPPAAAGPALQSTLPAGAVAAEAACCRRPTFFGPVCPITSAPCPAQASDCSRLAKRRVRPAPGAHCGPPSGPGRTGTRPLTRRAQHTAARTAPSPRALPPPAGSHINTALSRPGRPAQCGTRAIPGQVRLPACTSRSAPQPSLLLGFPHPIPHAPAPRGAPPRPPRRAPGAPGRAGAACSSGSRSPEPPAGAVVLVILAACRGGGRAALQAPLQHMLLCGRCSMQGRPRQGPSSASPALHLLPNTS